MNLRRYYTVLSAAARLEGLRASASVALGMREAIVGTVLPAATPHREALVAAGYRCTEDLGAPNTDPHPDDARAALQAELVKAGVRAADAREALVYLFPQ